MIEPLISIDLRTWSGIKISRLLIPDQVQYE